MNITREQAQKVFAVLGGREYVADRYGRKANALYMTNPNHSAINALLKRFKAEHGVPQNFPLSDTQRTQFELSLLNSAALKAIFEMVEENEKRGEVRK